jgi:hypothetical protein
MIFKNLKISTYKTIILLFFLYRCETWCLTLREEHKSWVFENKVLRTIFGSKREEVVRGWRRIITCMFQQIILGWSSKMDETGRVCSSKVWYGT